MSSLRPNVHLWRQQAAEATDCRAGEQKQVGKMRTPDKLWGVTNFVLKGHVWSLYKKAAKWPKFISPPPPNSTLAVLSNNDGVPSLWRDMNKAEIASVNIFVFLFFNEIELNLIYWNSNRPASVFTAFSGRSFRRSRGFVWSTSRHRSPRRRRPSRTRRSWPSSGCSGKEDKEIHQEKWEKYTNIMKKIPAKILDKKGENIINIWQI